MWVFNYNRYPTKNDKPEEDVRKRIKDIVLKRAQPTDQEIALISLFKACELTNEIFEKTDRAKAKKRIEQISESSSISKAISSTVQEIMAAIVIMIVTSTVTTTVIS